MVLCNEDLKLENFVVNGSKNGSAKSYCEKCLYDRSAEKKKYCESSSDSLVLKLAGGLDMKKLVTTTPAPIEYVTLSEGLIFLYKYSKIVNRKFIHFKFLVQIQLSAMKGCAGGK